MTKRARKTLRSPAAAQQINLAERLERLATALRLIGRHANVAQHEIELIQQIDLGALDLMRGVPRRPR